MNDLKDQHEDTRFSSAEQGKRVVKIFKKQLRVANRTDQTVKNYARSSEGLRHALAAAVKKARIRKEVNMHILRHSFATHCIEHGMNIKTLQYLMGHSSVLTTMIYLHISQVPLEHAFSPIDKWEI